MKQIQLLKKSMIIKHYEPILKNLAQIMPHKYHFFIEWLVFMTDCI